MSKKMTKGAFAIGAGVVLLLGGAGTYALWTVTEELDGTVQTGDLDLVLDAESATWTLNGSTPVTDIDALRLVPGDSVTLSQDLLVTAVGDNLNAQLTVTEASALVPEFAEHFTVDLDLDTAWNSTGNVVDVPSAQPGAAPYEVTAHVTVAFDPNTGGQDATDVSVDFGALEFILAQQPRN
ncbi:alternate-type signal peptide domain-containing protein [Bogoriella caseilytica]|uniref:Alternate signal-mediated exported protein n=1 Tax=Bogoriella caseilytica TaxID=56055 RepID=A0A3N2BE84_9MICO|nr:alternate-type signal peptide domain-containing protein [Bogoriella caseilytica]ROR73354.1 alternate signal-mediated exported protein [Bogoriella caseilytica]